MSWEETYAEAANKIRWALSTTASANGVPLSFPESQALAAVFAGDALKLWKMREEKPDLRWDRTTLSDLLGRELTG
jgi:hypothetical protein